MLNRKRILLAFLTLPLLLLTACDLDTIAEVKGDPFKFEKNTARVGGIVTRSYGVMGYGFYEVQDRTGTIFVVSQGRGVPGKGAKVEVKGNAKNAFVFEGMDYGTVLLEGTRKIHR
jgi:hypothetical protein